ncbi:antilisterial bacteriocin subtilosin biosynthesis protein AlbA [archaeon BMS3Abin16]|nr:antilisterial bacteriocin subtilosin biosynthesis protein AlbA [archaeon BMS3Abin16]
MDSKSRPYAPQFHRLVKADVILLIDHMSPNWVAVNTMGERLLSLCNGERSVEDICRVSGLDVSVEAACAFFDEGLSRGIISDVPFVKTAYSGRRAYLKDGLLEELWVYLTDRCNLRCRHCLVDAGGGESENELSLVDWKLIIKEAVPLGLKRVFITGGEPFLREDLFDLAEYVLVELGLELVVLTNGTLLDEMQITQLAALPGLTIQVSLEAASPETHDSVRGCGSYARASQAVDRLIAAGVRTIVTSTATKYNLGEIPALNEQLRSRGAVNHHLLWVHMRGRARENDVAADITDLTSLMRGLNQRGAKNDNWDVIRARVSSNPGVKIDGCHAGVNSLSVGANGDVYPCPSMVGDEDFVCGTVSKGVENVWTGSEELNRFRELSVVDLEGCRECVFRFFCGGGCRCQAYYGGGEDHVLSARDPYCSVIREMLVEGMTAGLRPNGSGMPEFLGGMAGGEGCATAGCPSTANGSVVAPFRCTCVLDVAGSEREATVKRYSAAALNPEKELCCPTGYTDSELTGLPANTLSISYGCGNPTAFASLNVGERVLDLGSGGGIDCFIAAKKVGATGRVVGVDMTDEMLKQARVNNLKMAEQLGYDIVEFRKGLLEVLPVESESMDLVISNCVINLSPEKEKVFSEIFRVLSPGGRFSISDIVSDTEVPEDMKRDAVLWSGCISGALTKKQFINGLKNTGFTGIVVEKNQLWKKEEGISFYSVTIIGRKG